MTRSGHHPAVQSNTGLRLYGRRVVLRALVPVDFSAWSEVRVRNEEWLETWEPSRAPHQGDPARDRDAFSARCAARDRDRQGGTGHAFGLFVDGALVGEVNVNNIIRGAMQSGTIGYWVDHDRAGRGFVPEGVVVVMRYAFEDLRLHRLEICVIPRNVNSRRVVEKLEIREEGLALRYLEINGAWEDHVRYGITVEEWEQRCDELSALWL